jgi:hypothetical protein
MNPAQFFRIGDIFLGIFHSPIRNTNSIAKKPHPPRFIFFVVVISSGASRMIVRSIR